MFKLQNIRHARHIKWPVYFGFGLIIISFVFFYGWNQSGKGRGPGGMSMDFARLRSESLNPFKRWTHIDTYALKAAHRDAVNEKYRVLPELPPQFMQMLQQQKTLEHMVTTQDDARTAADEIVLNRTAREMGVRISQESVIGLMLKQPGITDELLERNALEMGLGDKYQYVDYIRRQQEEQIVQEIKSLVVHSSLFELWQEYRLANDKLVLRMAAYPAATFESKVNVTPKDLEDYLAAHKSEFTVPAQRRYQFIKLRKEELRNAIKPTKEQLQVYYEKNQSQYLNKPATRIMEITAPLGENEISTAAQALLTVRAEASKTDDWTTLTQTLNKKFKGADFAFNSTWVDDDSTVYPADFMKRIKTMTADQGATVTQDGSGHHLLRVLEHRKTSTPPLDTIRPRVEGDYKDAEAENRFQAEVERFKAERKKMAENAAGTTVSLRALAQRLKVKDEVTTRVAASDADLPGIGSFNSDRAYLTSLGLHELSEVIETPDPDKRVVVLEVVEQTEAYDPSLAEIKAKVDLAVRKARSVDLARAAAEQSLKLVDSGADFNKALADAPKPPFDSGEFTRVDPVGDLGAPLIDFKKQTLKVNVGSTGLSGYGQSPEKPEGYAVWKVQKLIAPKQEDFIKDRPKFERDFLQVQRETLVREWLADQRNKAQYSYLDPEAAK